MKTLPSSCGCFEILVSDEDFEFLSQWTWYVSAKDSVPFGVHTGCGKQAKRLSHEILKRRGILFTGVVDHKDRNHLNNQFENLRPATRSQNQMNRGVYASSSTGYKGVSYHSARNKYVAMIKASGQNYFLGRFIDPKEAAKAYDRAAKKFFGEFAVLNFPEST